jgi:hypothetical protein
MVAASLPRVHHTTSKRHFFSFEEESISYTFMRGGLGGWSNDKSESGMLSVAHGCASPFVAKDLTFLFDMNERGGSIAS